VSYISVQLHDRHHSDINKTLKYKTKFSLEPFRGTVQNLEIRVGETDRRPRAGIEHRRELIRYFPTPTVKQKMPQNETYGTDTVLKIAIFKTFPYKSSVRSTLSWVTSHVRF